VRWDFHAGFDEIMDDVGCIHCITNRHSIVRHVEFSSRLCQATLLASLDWTLTNSWMRFARFGAIGGEHVHNSM
jgi:hypothetical protein